MQKSSHLKITKNIKAIRFNNLKAGNIKLFKKLPKCRIKFYKVTRWSNKWINFKKSVVISMYLIKTSFSQRLVFIMSTILNINSTLIHFASQIKPLMALPIDNIKFPINLSLIIFCKSKNFKVIPLQLKFKDKIQIIKNKKNLYNTF